MHGNPVIQISLLYGFLLVLARVAGIFIFLPLPGLKAAPDAAKVTLALALTFALYSRWPLLNPAPRSVVHLAGLVLMEAGIGLATGLAVAFIIEGLLVAAQAISTQAGCSYAFSRTVWKRTHPAHLLSHVPGWKLWSCSGRACSQPGSGWFCR
jgi:flagellar biosynthetic protein FliR